MNSRKILVMVLWLVFMLSLLGCSESSVSSNDLSSSTSSSSSSSSNSEIINNPIEIQTTKADGNKDLNILKESEKFKLYCNQKDDKNADKMLEVLEKSSDDILKALNCKLENKVVIKMYPDLQTFHNSINYPDAPADIIGAGLEDGIHIVSPEDMGGASISSPESVYIHEFTHIAVASNGVIKPVWMNEGIASYFGKQIPDVKWEIVPIIQSGNIPKLEELSGSHTDFSEVSGYPFSYTIIEFIINRFGNEGLVKIMSKPDDFKGCFNMSKSQFQSEWEKYLQKNYSQM